MSGLLCRCGEDMHNMSCPSPYVLYIYYRTEADTAIADDPQITLHNFMLGWDEKNECRRNYMVRTERVYYWFCPVCGRVYEVQLKPRGRWLRIYKPSNAAAVPDAQGWHQIYVMTDMETDAVMEDEPDILLKDYLESHDDVICLLSPDERTMFAKDKGTGKVLYSYELEDSWRPKED